MNTAAHTAAADRGLDTQWILPDWPAPVAVRALITTRRGGVSRGPFGVFGGGDGGMNLGRGSGESPEVVFANRARLRAVLPDEPRWLHQVHGAEVVDAAKVVDDPPEADASVAVGPGAVCAVTIADCMPVLLASTCGRVVGAAHAGWRGLAAGVIQNTVAAMLERVPDAELIAYLGPAIGPAAFEVGGEILDAMRRRLPHAETGFVPARSPGKFVADLFALGTQALAQAGVRRVYGGGDCTFSDPERFYSYRRDRVTGRHAALIWINGEMRVTGVAEGI
jgi:YfiH family protein